ncbi:MAG: methylenetetrahydrofolate reductase [NAD(P)H] [Desulfovibrio sp.]
MRIRELIAGKRPFLSFEFFPPKEKDAWPDFFKVVSDLQDYNPLFVSVTYGAGGGTQDNTLDIVTHMKNEMGLEPMAHLTCVGASEDSLRDFLTRLKAAGIDNILALRGDPPRDLEGFTFEGQPFQYASDLAKFTKDNFPDMGIGVAGYPEAHLEAPTIKEDFQWTEHKIKAGGEFIITQLFFDNRMYFDYVDRLKGLGVDVPVVPGILPIMSLKSVKFILSLCGAAIPGRFLSQLEKAYEEGGDEAVMELGLEHARQQAQELIDKGAPGIHLYTLNRSKPCMALIEKLKF